MKLRELEIRDVPRILEWMHDEAVYKNFRFDPDRQSFDTVSAFVKSSMTEHDRHYAIVDDADLYQGTISLKNIDSQNKTADYAIVLRSDAQGKGFAAAATEAVLEIAFSRLALNRVYLNVLSENTRAQRLYEAAGFVYEGEFREHLFIRGQYRDLKWYGLLKSDYLKGKK